MSISKNKHYVLSKVSNTNEYMALNRMDEPNAGNRGYKETPKFKDAFLPVLGTDKLEVIDQDENLDALKSRNSAIIPLLTIGDLW